MNNYIKGILITVVMLPGLNAAAQKKQVAKFQKTITEAVKKAYPASVRMWGFDVQQNQRTSAQFSGVVVSADGYILTAAHTILPSKNYKVFFPDGRECIALALGKIDNKETPGIPDVGMMKITDKGTYPFAEMGYSASLVKNEPCISISYPETLNQTLPTLRLGNIAEVKNEYGFIRSTCKMEPGDSGGPLFDYYGRVIGLHSAIDVSEEMNFEIPVDLYRGYWTALNSERLYTAFPEKKDSVKTDPLSLLLQRESKQKALHPDFDLSTPKNSCFSIKSIIKGKSQHIYATLLNVNIANGAKKQFLLTKNTMVGEQMQCEINGVAVPIRLIGKDQENDLVLFELEQRITGGIDLNISDSNSVKIEMGKLLYSIDPSGKVMHSVLGSTLFNLPKINSQPYLGAMVVYSSSPIQFSLIKKGSPAEKAGIKVGDELISINGKTMKKASEFAPEILKYWADDELTLEWQNASGKMSKTLKLEGRGQSVFNHPAEKFEGGKSGRRDGFNAIFTHDAAIKANACGSPVFDWEGNFYGINIARYSRTTTVVMPKKTIAEFILKSIQ
ncbi:trypsin-like peptidase domain-containing protein [Pedobacter sp. D749]|uniref:trypsin-like peptidase domain-containing protein n=1 Tax=Pedobacter sp. D749 TaxID=2856523 RepID=UPI001C58DBFA|nr:trypsin-like peptidase domain-containing protein [Pedobacter sp. D749]QXU43702.1 trypsin-like peptidase domain-containing protein [Pedobacter sp. D749]